MLRKKVFSGLIRRRCVQISTRICLCVSVSRWGTQRPILLLNPNCCKWFATVDLQHLSKSASSLVVSDESDSMRLIHLSTSMDGGLPSRSSSSSEKFPDLNLLNQWEHVCLDGVSCPKTFVRFHQASAAVWPCWNSYKRQCRKCTLSRVIVEKFAKKEQKFLVRV